jgi:alanyl-tRNA synthetase
LKNPLWLKESEESWQLLANKHSRYLKINKAQRAASEIQEKVVGLKTLEGQDLCSSLKSVSKELEQAQLPVVTKNQLRDEFSEIKKKYDDADKLRKTLESKEAVELIKKAFEDDPKMEIYVGVVNKTGNTKALSQAIQHVKTTDKAALLIAVDTVGGKVSHQCVVPQSFVEKGLKANEWAGVVMEKVGGKKGGNDTSAQGMGDLVSNVEEAVKLAIDFGKLKI